MDREPLSSVHAEYNARGNGLQLLKDDKLLRNSYVGD